MLPSKFGYIITVKCPDTRESIIDGKSCTLFVSTKFDQIVPELRLACLAITPAIVNPKLEELWCLEILELVCGPRASGVYIRFTFHE